MPAFIVQIFESAGADVDVLDVPAVRRVRQVRVQADSAQGVSAALGLHPAQVLSVRALHSASPGAGSGSGTLQHQRASIDLRLFSQELAVLLEAGIPLLESLQTLREKDDGGRGSAALDAVIGALRDGLPVSAALGHAPQAFDALFIALVAASERSGQLTETLRHHAAYLAWRDALQNRLRAALVYPLMLLAAGGAVILFLLLYVLPRFAGVFDGLGRELPLASRWLIDLGVLAAAHPLAALGSALAMPMALLLAWRLPASRAALPALLWRLPGLGPPLRLVALARLYRVLGLLLSAGVPAPAALRLASPVLAPPLRPALAQVLRQVDNGQRLSQAMQDQRLATPVAWRMLRVGESSGELPAMLTRAAGFHDEQIARLSDLVSRLVNPLLMLVMGVVIGGIVVLMYLPIFTLMETVQ